jgi:hypothetical protein
MTQKWYPSSLSTTYYDSCCRVWSCITQQGRTLDIPDLICAPKLPETVINVFFYFVAMTSVIGVPALVRDDSAMACDKVESASI